MNKEIKEVVERGKSKFDSKVTTRDLLFYIIERLDDQQKRLSIVEEKQKLLYYLLPISITLVSIIIKIA